MTGGLPLRVLMLLSKPLKEDPRVVREASALQAAGHHVVVLQWARFDPDAAPEGEVSGIPVVRFPLTGLPARLPSSVLRTPFWWGRAFRHARELHGRERFDVVHAHDLDTLPVGVRLKKRFGVKLVYDAHEIFSYMIEGDQPWGVPQAADRLERRLLRHADRMVTAGDAFAEHYSRLYGGPITVVHNALWDAPGPWEPPTAEAFTVVYIGTLSRDRLFPGLVSALGGLPGVRFLLGGKKEGVYAQVAEAARRERGVEFLGPVPHEEVFTHTRASHLVLVPWDPRNRQYRIQLANKVYDAMAAGRPLLGTNGTATGAFCERHGFGLSVDYDPQAIRDAVLRLSRAPEEAERMGRTGHEMARREYHWGPQGERLVEVYRGL